MPLPIQLISTDFDGTLFTEFENPPVPETLIRILGELQRQGAKWVINTGRDMSSLMETLARGHIPLQPDYLVLVEREIHFHQESKYAPLADWNVACARDQATLFERIKPDLPNIYAWISSRFKATVYEDAYSPFCLIAADNSDADIIHEYLNEYCRTIPHLTVVRNDVYARFSHAAYNKGTAMAQIARCLGIPRECVFAVGDHLNDLPMLSTEYAGMIAAPQNAVPLVKASVLNQNGYLSPLSHGAGVADALQNFLGRP